MKVEWTNKDVLTHSETTGRSKAILVIDMPKNCAECKIMFLQGIGEGICNAVDWEERPSWCPLKPLPSKKVPVFDPNSASYDEEYEKRTIDEISGWNACIEEIEK